ncbi:putative tricarboxylate transporter mitochondrial carrier protein [Microdochium trichocladiopsis]|uniref:Tricarboxylate transporter mitochondrial carrier protein n=1 Tax=Microdochium trichocladiopsis TaxID=1682393 RepID=A0A9P9BJI6_9PEZI|nr:putative tricarboxylate transporter mitochondrial carrier protein [Microdochium trichocladiopsis]KAH7018135.1 putative tricarboxylate transporter mitochondrial carrier protein [Microdochium trichocladiopsis]
MSSASPSATSAASLATAATPRQDAFPQANKKPSAMRSILAGALAGGVEIAITYPADFAKTRTQLNRNLADGKKLPWPPFGPQWYAGCTTAIVGNSAKAAIRFLSFEQYKRLLSDADGKISGPKNVLAGFGAGVTESLFAVTPSESIKTTLVDDRKSAKPRLRGFLHAVPVIARERGIRGFFQGLVPTAARQSANSAVRFGSYTSLKQLAESYTAPGEKLGTVATFGIGSVAGAITVYTTQPLDTIKTRMQTPTAKEIYGGSSLRCAAMILKQEGVLTFWSGAMPRLARLVMSGGIIFTMYEKSIELFNKLDPEGRYI